MEDLKRKTIILSLIQRLEKNGSWCGETHIQKSIYLLKVLLAIDLNLDFILYKHGPYSFDLNEQLKIMQAESLLSLEPMSPYGPSFRLGDMAGFLLKTYEHSINKIDKKLDFIAENVGNRKVIDLEKISTAIFISSETQLEDHERIAERIHEIKPHIDVSEALTAITEAKKITTTAKQIK